MGILIKIWEWMSGECVHLWECEEVYTKVDEAKIPASFRGYFKKYPGIWIERRKCKKCKKRETLTRMPQISIGGRIHNPNYWKEVQ